MERWDARLRQRASRKGVVVGLCPVKCSGSIYGAPSDNIKLSIWPIARHKATHIESMLAADAAHFVPPPSRHPSQALHWQTLLILKPHSHLPLPLSQKETRNAHLQSRPSVTGRWEDTEVASHVDKQCKGRAMPIPLRGSHLCYGSNAGLPSDSYPLGGGKDFSPAVWYCMRRRADHRGPSFFLRHTCRSYVSGLRPAPLQGVGNVVDFMRQSLAAQGFLLRALHSRLVCKQDVVRSTTDPLVIILSSVLAPSAALYFLLPPRSPVVLPQSLCRASSIR